LHLNHGVIIARPKRSREPAQTLRGKEFLERMAFVARQRPKPFAERDGRSHVDNAFLCQLLPRPARRFAHKTATATWSLWPAASNIIALFIILTTAATPNAHGVTDVQTSSQAAEALRPIAGRFFAFTIFALGIIGTGLLALPVLAGSAACAVGEALQWRVGLAQRPGRARAFYGTIAAATCVGAVLNFTPLDPIKALFWSAVINGVAMVMIMLVGSRHRVIGQFTLTPWLTVLGWVASAVMAGAAIGMFATWGSWATPQTGKFSPSLTTTGRSCASLSDTRFFQKGRVCHGRYSFAFGPPWNANSPSRNA
jgi:hypothetical protein